MTGALTMCLGVVPGVATLPVVARGTLRARPQVGRLAVLMVPNADVAAQTRAALTEAGFAGPLLFTASLDDVLDFAPDLVLVQDLLESNPSGSRHLTRRQDVEELRAAGLPVAAAAAVTQFRAARGVVRHHTGILPRNTLPDSLINEADRIDFIDVAAAVLLDRRSRGDVRLRAVPEALCAPEALAALRELGQDIARRSGGTASGAEGELAGRVLVLLGQGTSPERLIRAGHRLAEAAGARWSVASLLDLETDGSTDLPEALRLAERLGAEVIDLGGDQPPAGQALADRIIAHAHGHHVTDIVIGRPAVRGLSRLFGRPLADRLSGAAAGVAIHMVSDSPPRPWRPVVPWRIGAGRWWWSGAAIATLATAAAAGAIHLAQGLMPPDTLSIIMLMPVLYAATALGLGVAIYTAVLGVAVFNVLFLPPVWEFTPLAPENVLLLGLFILVAGLTANLSKRLHDQAATAQRREHDTAALFRLAREIATAPTPEDVLKAVVRQLDEILGLNSTLFLPAPEGRTEAPPPLRPAHPPARPVSAREAEALAWVTAHGRPAGTGTGTFDDCAALFWPLRTPHGAVGVLGLDDIPEDTARQPGFRRRLESLAGLAAVAIERMMLSREIEAARFTAQTESLRSALLSSISHDLRTPLASIIGSATSLLSFGRTYDEAVRDDLMRTILEEAERLNRFVGNLLQMTKLESGAIVPKRQWIDVDDLVATTLDRMERRLRGHHVRVEEAR